MPGGPTRPEPYGQLVETGEAQEYLAAVLRTARSRAIEDGADPDAVTADLAERLRRLRQLQAADRDESTPGQTKGSS